MAKLRRVNGPRFFPLWLCPAAAPPASRLRRDARAPFFLPIARNLFPETSFIM